MQDDNLVFGDEQFIRQMGKEYNPPHENNILDGFIIVDEEKIVFERRNVLEGRLSVLMPEAFVIMPLELAEKKYPAIQRPDEIYTNNETTVNFCVSLKNDKATNEDIPRAKEIIKQAVMRMNAGSQVINSETIDVSGINISYFDFCSAALDADIYNMMFFLSIDNRIVVGSFNCPWVNMDVWKPVIEQMFETMETS